MNTLTYNTGEFFLDGKPFTILSGAIHYFRIPREYWHDRLLKLRACGFNTVETYVCWNLHESQEGNFDFSGNLDIAAFIDEAAEIGLKVILRPGPYICSEWDLGGLPSWLLTYRNMPLRCYDRDFLKFTERYFTKLFEILSGRLACDGGNIIAVQAENEYGSYGNDHLYIKEITDMLLRLGVKVPLFTSDGPSDTMFNGGTIDNILAVANFGSKTEKAFDFLEKRRPQSPKMCGEFWCGWFDHWHEEHLEGDGRDSESVVKELKTLLELGGSFNIYMFCGGTNFGFWNGANYMNGYKPTVTSYDFDAPLNEAGDMTEKYYKIKSLLEEKFGPAPNLNVKNSEKSAYGTFRPVAYASLFDNLSVFGEPIYSSAPLTMEQLGQDFGFVLYKTEIHCSEPLPINVGEARDRISFYIDQKFYGIHERSRRQDSVIADFKNDKKHSLMLLCENMGRVNYGPMLRDEKGLLSGVLLGDPNQYGQQYRFGWQHYSLRMESEELKKLVWCKTAEKNIPTFYKIPFDIKKVSDTFLRLDGFTHGFACINGHNLGRYYNTAGPQKTLYVPAPWLFEGENELIVFETDKADDSACVVFLNTPEN